MSWEKQVNSENGESLRVSWNWKIKINLYAFITKSMGSVNHN